MYATSWNSSGTLVVANRTAWMWMTAKSARRGKEKIAFTSPRDILKPDTAEQTPEFEGEQRHPATSNAAIGAPGLSGVGRRPGSSPGRQSGERDGEAEANTVEAAIVWGLIGALCLVVLVELAGKLSYDRALANLQEGRKSHTAETGFTKDLAIKLVEGRPRRNDQKKSKEAPQELRVEVVQPLQDVHMRSSSTRRITPSTAFRTGEVASKADEE